MGWLEAHHGHNIMEARISKQGNMNSRSEIRYYCITCRTVGPIVGQPKSHSLGDLNGVRECYGHYYTCPFTIDVCPIIQTCKDLADKIEPKLIP